MLRRRPSELLGLVNNTTHSLVSSWFAYFYVVHDYRFYMHCQSPPWINMITATLTTSGTTSTTTSGTINKPDQSSNITTMARCLMGSDRKKISQTGSPFWCPPLLLSEYVFIQLTLTHYAEVNVFWFPVDIARLSSSGLPLAGVRFIGHVMAFPGTLTNLYTLSLHDTLPFVSINGPDFVLRSAINRAQTKLPVTRRHPLSMAAV